MKRDIPFWQFIGFTLVSIGGTLLHFLYDWANQALWLAPFSGVNESTWEHMKLLYFPAVICALIQHRIFKDCPRFWCAKTIGISTGLAAIPVLFYTYNGIFGVSPDYINIAIFFISTAVAFFIETRLFRTNYLSCKHPWIARGILALFGILFMIFTFVTPHIPLFRDPLTGTYGLYG